MQAASEAAGWQCEYRQIEAGRLEARTVYQPVGSSSLVCETANRRLDISASTPKKAVTIMVPMSRTSVLINGRRLSDGRLLVLAPDIDFHASSNSGDEVWSMHLDTDLIDGELDRLGERAIDGKFDVLVHVRSLIMQALSGKSCERLAQLEATAADLGAELLEADSVDSDPYHYRLRRKALARAMEYMEAHMGGAVRMADVSTFAGVSLSTLKRLFRREFQQVPTEYLTARRLDALRRELKRSANADRTIADLAAEQGFTHMGRLSSVYRRQFGVLPSVDRL